MAEYYAENFESYSELFRDHAVRFSELMKTLDDEIIGLGLPPVGKSKDLFQMAMDLTYHADRAYKDKYCPQEAEFKLTTYMSKDEILSSMRTVFTEEFARYMDGYGTK